MLQNLFRSRRRDATAEELYALAVAQARRPEFYARMGVEDRIDSRFELYTLHVLLLVMRLRDEGGAGADTAQTLFDTYVSALDHTLRELGVGDLSISKKMRRLGESLYGRMTSYEAPLRSGDREALAAALARNVFEREGAEAAGVLADYALASRAKLADQSAADLGRAPAWAEIPA